MREARYTFCQSRISDISSPMSDDVESGGSVKVLEGFLIKEYWSITKGYYDSGKMSFIKQLKCMKCGAIKHSLRTIDSPY